MSDSVDPTENTSAAASSGPTNSADAAGFNAAEDVADFEQQIAAAKKEAADNYDRFIRVTADLENFRRRTVREKDELRQFAAGRVLEDLLPIIDNLSLALTAAKAPNADLKNLVGGLGMVQDQLRNALSSHGLKEINPVGQVFDPNQHESISSQPSKDVPEGSVLQVVRTGYTLNGRLLRPASVIVSSGSAKG